MIYKIEINLSLKRCALSCEMIVEMIATPLTLVAQIFMA